MLKDGLEHTALAPQEAVAAGTLPSPDTQVGLVSPRVEAGLPPTRVMPSTGRSLCRGGNHICSAGSGLPAGRAIRVRVLPLQLWTQGSRQTATHLYLLGCRCTGLKHRAG